MKRTILLLVAAACSALALADPYRNDIRVAAVGGGGYPGYMTPTTAAGAAMSGMSQVLSSAGQYNEATSEAAVNMTVANRNQLNNDMLATQTYFSMRAANHAAREREREPRLTMQQLVKIAAEGAPKSLSSSQQDPVSGGLQWPSALQQDSFSAGRNEMDQLFAKRARYGGLTYSDQILAKNTIDSMFDSLKSQIRVIPPQDYVGCRDFLRSLVYASSKSDLP